MGSLVAKPTRPVPYSVSLKCCDCQLQGQAAYHEIVETGQIICVFCLETRRRMGNDPF